MTMPQWQTRILKKDKIHLFTILKTHIKFETTKRKENFIIKHPYSLYDHLKNLNKGNFLSVILRILLTPLWWFTNFFYVFFVPTTPNGCCLPILVLLSSKQTCSLSTSKLYSISKGNTEESSFYFWELTHPQNKESDLPSALLLTWPDEIACKCSV